MDSKIVGRWFPSRLVVLGIVLACIGPQVWCQTGSRVDQGLLSPGIPRDFELPEGTAHVFDLEVDPGVVWQLEVEQLGVDLRLEVEVGDEAEGAVLRTFDNPLLRFGPELLVIGPAVPGPARLVVSASAKHPGDGTYRIRWTRLDDGSQVDDPTLRDRLHRARALSRAGELCATGEVEDRHEAMEIYRRVAQSSPPIDRRTRALALTAFAQLAYEATRVDEALASFREVFPIWKSLGDTVLAADALSDLGLLYLDRGEIDKARDFLTSALELQETADNPYGKAVAESNLCFLELMTGNSQLALPCFEKVLGLHHATGDLEEQAKTHMNLAAALATLGESSPALEHLGRAMALFRQLGDPAGEAQARNNLASIHEGIGEVQQALGHYTQALTAVRAVGDRRWEARVLNNLGASYWRLGDLSRAQTLLEQALVLRLETGDARGEAITRTLLGRLHLRRGAHAEATEAFRQALALGRQRSDLRREGRTLGFLTQVALATDDLEMAAEHSARGLEILQTVGDRQGEGRLRLERARLHLRAGDLDPSEQELEQALRLLRAVHDHPLEIEVLVEQARLERRRGQWQRAVASAEMAIERLEELRTPVASPVLRASLVGTLRTAYELAIELQLDHYRQSGDDRSLRRAFRLTERARARSLIDLLTELQTTVDPDLPDELRQRRREARRRLDHAAEARSELLAQDPGSPEAAVASRQVVEALGELEQVEADIRHRSAVAVDLTTPALVGVDDVAAMLDPGTLWLQYALGESRSVVWAIGRDTTTLHELPPRTEFEGAVRDFHQELSTYDPAAGPPRTAHAEALGRALLAPIVGRLDAIHRLVVVPDGALHYLPFAALPRPDDRSPDGSRLVDDFEIVTLPSASTLALQRRRRSSRTPAPRSLAILADPVFDAADPRRTEGAPSRPAPPGAPLVVGPAELGPALRGLRDGFARLPSSRREAETIAALYPPEGLTLLLDFDADRSRFLAALSGHRRIHVATHGLLDSDRPELSGLVLSRVDASGRPQEGSIRVHDLFGLDLQAELVVLSGCRTALGREIRGEGLVGMTRGFMDAGAERVVASLWNVQDHATAELMIAFHHRLSEGLPAAAALRSAQREIRAQRRWKDPYFWAGFVVQGDWR